MSSYVTDADIKAGYRTDHSMITLTLTFRKDTKRNLLWKFNSSLLKDQMYVDAINDTINSVMGEYAALPREGASCPHADILNSVQYL